MYDASSLLAGACFRCLRSSPSHHKPGRSDYCPHFSDEKAKAREVTWFAQDHRVRFKSDGDGIEPKCSDPKASAPKHSPAAQHNTGAPIVKVSTQLGGLFSGVA